jgi:hypothetical protein
MSPRASRIWEHTRPACGSLRPRDELLWEVRDSRRLSESPAPETGALPRQCQGLTKTIGRPLLAAEAVRDRAGDSFVFEELPSQEVRGIEGRVMIFAVCDEGG